MSGVEIVNPVPVAEARAWWSTLRTTFLQKPDDEALDRSIARATIDWDADRTWGARAEGRWVGTLVTFARSVTVPGPGDRTVDVAADALAGVTVNATHRRRGVLRSMLGSALDAARERGDAFSVLFAAEWPIYGRFGYAPATLEASYNYSIRSPGGGLRPAGDGQVRQIEPDEVADLAPPIMAAARRLRSGQIDRPAGWWPRYTGGHGYPRAETPVGNVVLHEGTGGPDGLLIWNPKSSFDIVTGMAGIQVSDLIAANATAYRNLWAYLASIDLVDSVTLGRRPIDEPVRWLLADGRALRQTQQGDGMWLRLLDVAAALSARGYGADGELVIEVTDTDHGGYAAGRYLLAAQDGAGVCAPTTQAADLRLSQRVLASLYLGGFSLAQLALLDQIEELRPGAIARADALFATALPPWNQTMF